MGATEAHSTPCPGLSPSGSSGHRPATRAKLRGTSALFIRVSSAGPRGKRRQQTHSLWCFQHIASSSGLHLAQVTMAGAGLTDVIASLQDGTSGVIFFFLFHFLKVLPQGLLTCFQATARMWSLAHRSPQRSSDRSKTPQDPSNSCHEGLRSSETHAMCLPPKPSQSRHQKQK